MSLEEARVLVPFSVLLPTLLPEGVRLSGCLLAPDNPPGWLGLTYVIDSGARNSLHIQQGPSVAAGAEDLVAWEHAMVDDVELRIQERGGEGFHTVEVFLTREGPGAGPFRSGQGRRGRHRPVAGAGMTKLGEVLELLHRREPRFRTLRLT